MHERQFNWQLANPTEPQFSSAKDDVTPFKVNGDPSTLMDQRIPTQSCQCAVNVTEAGAGNQGIGKVIEACESGGGVAGAGFSADVTVKATAMITLSKFEFITNWLLYSNSNSK